jgi:hypothetical protein
VQTFLPMYRPALGQLMGLSHSTLVLSHCPTIAGTVPLSLGLSHYRWDCPTIEQQQWDSPSKTVSVPATTLLERGKYHRKNFCPSKTDLVPAILKFWIAVPLSLGLSHYCWDRPIIADTVPLSHVGQLFSAGTGGQALSTAGTA